MEETGRSNHGQVFGGKVQYDRGGGGVTHRGGGKVQMPWNTVRPVRRLLDSSPRKHQEGKLGVGEALEVVLEGEGRFDSLGKVLLRGSAGGTLVWSGYMVAYIDNDAAVIGSVCEFPVAGHM